MIKSRLWALLLYKLVLGHLGFERGRSLLADLDEASLEVDLI
jgi:hypothetical protein